MKKLKDFLAALRIKSSTLILIATFYFAFAMNVSFWRYIFTHLEITNVATAWFALSLPFFMAIPLYWIFSLTIVPKVAKPLLCVLLLLCAATNYMMTRYGIYIDKNMIQNVFETNVREATDLMTASYIFWYFVSGILPAVLVCAVKIDYDDAKTEIKARLKKSLIALLIVSVFAGTAFKEYAAFGRNNRTAFRGLINIFNFVSGTRGHLKRLRLANRQLLILDDTAQKDEEYDGMITVLIFILGETARAANFSLNGYERDTNPLLAKQDIVYFKETTSCGTATALSVPCMFSYMTRSNFDSTDAQYTQNLIDLLQTGGYDVVWVDNDDGCKNVCDRVEKTEYTVKTNNPKYCNGQYCLDGVLLESLETALKNVKKDTVIVLHMMGSHGPTYFRRYPDEFKKFTPTCDTADIQNCTTQQIVNTYDNTILYTDYVVSSAIDILKKFPHFEGGLIYVSDHGESLGENNIYLHGMPYTIAPKEQIEVPMVLFMNENMKRFDFVDYDCMKKVAQTTMHSHDNLFHSILGLLEINTKEYDQNLDLFRACRTKKLRFEK